MEVKLIHFFLVFFWKRAYYYIMNTIDITPTWSALVPIMIEVLKNPKANKTAKAEVTQELLRLAKIVDDQNKKVVK
jgi:hypothetical protein